MMSESDKSGWLDIVYLSIAVFGTWFTIIYIFVSFVMELL